MKTNNPRNRTHPESAERHSNVVAYQGGAARQGDTRAATPGARTRGSYDAAAYNASAESGRDEASTSAYIPATRTTAQRSSSAHSSAKRTYSSPEYNASAPDLYDAQAYAPSYGDRTHTHNPRAAAANPYARMRVSGAYDDRTHTSSDYDEYANAPGTYDDRAHTTVAPRTRTTVTRTTTPVASRDAYSRGAYARNAYTREGSARDVYARNAYANASVKRRSHKHLIAAGVIVALCAVCAIAVAVVLLSPIRVTVNGEEVEVGGKKTVADAVEASSVEPHAGNLVSVEGVVLEEGAGQAYTATVNGSEADTDHALSAGDVVVITDGADQEEPSTVTEETQPYSAVIDGVGAVHVLETQGVDGTKTTKVGDLSGARVEEITQEPTDVVCRRFNIDSGGDKVIALTFDDGPNSAYTTQILDILAANNAKATFFTVGTNITGENIEVVKRAASEGHQISTHSYDHADGSGQGVNLSYMTVEEQIAEITKGYDAIKNATGAEVNTIIRTPGGNFPESVIANLSPYITAEIGWNIDTNDWQRPGAEVIAQRILKATAGDIVLMHDGGGDRSQTVEALRQALPQLAEQGYRFITIEELLTYAQ